MFGGGGGMNPRKMKQMMEQMGIDVEELDAHEVVIRTDEGDLVFDSPQVTKMDARGQETYQVLGDARLRDREAGGEAAESDDGGDGGDGGDGDTDPEIPDSDVEIVTGRTGASEQEAREALREVDGDLAAAVERLE